MAGDPDVVYVTRPIPESGLECLEPHCDVHVSDRPPQSPPAKETVTTRLAELQAEGLLCMLPDVVDETVLDASPNLRVVSTLSVGHDHVDVEAAAERGIAVGHTPGVLSETCADLVWALLLATSRRIVEGHQFVQDGAWQTWAPELLAGEDVHGATLGVVGLGKIGTAVARRGAGFDVDVRYTSRSPKPEREAELAERGIDAEYVSLDELLRRSDHVSVNVPLTEETEGMFGRDEFRTMSDSAVFVNTARGEIVDSDALYEALDEGWISRACLDVTDPEPLPSDHPLLEFAPGRLVVTPHIGSSSLPTRRRMARMAAENVLAGVRGEALPNAVFDPTSSTNSNE
jgi:glyoxylate reductase